jgi:hypothetical protein
MDSDRNKVRDIRPSVRSDGRFVKTCQGWRVSAPPQGGRGVAARPFRESRLPYIRRIGPG